jgi:GPN-loop GTPase
MKEFFETMGEKKAEYEREYKPELERRIREREEEKKTEGLDRLMNDMKVQSGQSRRGTFPLVVARAVADIDPVHLETISDGEDEDDGYLVDPDPVDDEDDEEGLQKKFAQAARNAQMNAEDRDFERWANEINRGGI